MLLESIQDICNFLITFHTAISFSTPHIYISTRPFLPSQSFLLRMFSREFTRAINIRVGMLSSWPAPPLEWTGHAESIWSVCYSLDGTRVVSGSSDKTIRIWDAESGTVIGEPLTGHTGGVNSVAYSPDAEHIISGSSHSTIRIWAVESGTAVGNALAGHVGSVWSVAYSPDGRYIISGSYDRTIRIWDGETGISVRNPHSDWVRSVAYSPNGCHIVSGCDDRTIRIWDAETGNAVGNPLEGHGDYVRSVAYSPDGNHIISGSDDRTIRIWEVENGTAVGNPPGRHTGVVNSIAYSSDRKRIASGSCDETTLVLDPFLHVPLPSSSCDSVHPDFFAKPDISGWVRDSEGGLLYWVPLDIRPGVHSPALLTIPLTSRYRSVSLDFDDFAFGTSWTQIVKCTSS